MIVLADNDIIHKLACCELLPEFLLWLKAPPAEIWVLPSLAFMLRKKLKGNTVALECLEKFLSHVKIIPAAQISTMTRFSSLDVGEGQMLAVLVENKQVSQIVTGDKRALSLISQIAATDEDLSNRLRTAKIDCLESVMLGLIDQFGFPTINAKATRGVKSDKVIALSFGNSRSQAHAVVALNSYLTALQGSAAFVASYQPT